jgi:hypothetical protein
VAFQFSDQIMPKEFSARVVFRDPRFAPPLRHQTCRFRAQIRDRGGRDPQPGMIPKNGFPVFEKDHSHT